MAGADALRVQVRITADLHPELFAALVDVRTRGRADRLRQLALLGLTGQRSAHLSDATSGAGADAPQSSNTTQPEAADPRRARILGALTLAD
jgi:hypothetical protein